MKNQLNFNLNRAIQSLMLSQLGVTSLVFADDGIQALSPIVMTANVDQGLYQHQHVNLDGFATSQLQQLPVSMTLINDQLMTDQQARTVGDVLKNEAASGDGYAGIGYYPNFMLRGFALDLASSYLLNGQPIRGEQVVALENKQQIEVLKGISALQSGLSTPAGVVNYVSKRPENVQSITLATDQHGQSSLALDQGAWLNDEQSLGYRFNLAAEAIHPYIEKVHGERYFASLALDWQTSEKSAWQWDIEWQNQRQKSVPGYQLLDGEVPQGVKWSRLLGAQPWGKPVNMAALNSALHYRYALSEQWKLALTASYSKAQVDDYTQFPWGCYSEICQYSGLGNTFDAQGYYDIYDYRNPNDTFVTQQLKAKISGEIELAQVTHAVSLVASHTEKTNHRHEIVNEWIGVGNIYHDNPVFSPSALMPGARYQSLDHKQWAVDVFDRIEWSPQWSSMLGLKWLHLDEQTYLPNGQSWRDTQQDHWLPHMALIYQPWQQTTLYASYSKGLSDGRSAAWFADNANEILAPMNSQQYEMGLKQQVNSFVLSAAVFDLRQDLQYNRPTAEGNYLFVQEGEQQSLGVELGLQGAISEQWDVMASLAFTRAQLNAISTANYAGHQAHNVPKRRLATQLSYRVPQIDGLRLLAGAQYSSSKFANKEASAQVKGYHVFDAGAVYSFMFNAQQARLHFNVDNIFNKKYWRDAGEFVGDNYLFLGAPRTAKLSLQLNF